MARKGTTTFNGKTGVWRTVGGRRIFIATGESLEEAMRKSGKFGKSSKSSTIGEPLPAMSTYLEKHGVNYADLDSDEVREYLKEYRRTGKIESLENSKDSNKYNFSKEQLDKVWENEDATEVYDYLTSKEKSTMKMAQKDAEMGNKDAQEIVDKLDREAASRFIESNSPDYIKSNDSKGPGKIQKEYDLKDVRNEMYVDMYKKGDMDTAEFRQKMLQGGESIETVDKAIAKSLSNDTDKTIQMKGGDKTQYKVLDEATDSMGEKIYKVMENGQEKWVQGDLFEENSAAGKALKNIQESNKADRAKKAQADLDASLNDYKDAKMQYDKIVAKTQNMDWGSDEYKALRPEKEQLYQKMKAAKTAVINKFSETMPDEDMYKVAEEVSGIKGLKFTKTMQNSYQGEPYSKYQSNDIKDQSGVFSAVLKEARIETFNSSFSLDEKTGEPRYWGTLSLRYEHKGGGSNGIELMDIRYSRKNGWEIRDASGYVHRNGKKLSTVADMKQYFIDAGYSASSAQDMATEYINNRIVK